MDVRFIIINSRLLSSKKWYGDLVKAWLEKSEIKRKLINNEINFFLQNVR